MANKKIRKKNVNLQPQIIEKAQTDRQKEHLFKQIKDSSLDKTQKKFAYELLGLKTYQERSFENELAICVFGTLLAGDITQLNQHERAEVRFLFHPKNRLRTIPQLIL